MQIIKVCFIVLAIVLLGFSAQWGEGVSTIAKAAEIHWTYQNLSGPDHWAELDPSFAACTSGQAQSPINLTAADSVDLVDPHFHYEPVPLNLLNNGHTVQIPYAPGSYMMVDGEQYNLLQFHFHSPSEHAIEGKVQSAELHLVHQSEAGQLAVLAILLQGDEQISESVAGYRELSQVLPAKAGDRVRTEETINAQTLLPTKATTYRYSGSLTTPPCTEAVNWLVMTEPVKLPPKQISQYERLLNHNNRPLQQLNLRRVQIDMSF